MADTNYVLLRQRWQDSYYLGRNPVRGTATAASATVLTDSGIAMSGARASSFDHCWIKIVTTTDGAAPQGEIRQVSEGTFVPTTGAMTMQSAFSATLDIGDTYEVHYDLHPAEVDRLGAKVLRNVWAPEEIPLTADYGIIDDANMEASGVTPWTVSGATRTKVAAAGLAGGEQVLSVVDSGSGNGYARPAAFAVEPGLTYCVAALAQNQAGSTSRLRVVDADSGATIAETDVSSALIWRELSVQFTPPSTTTSVHFRLLSVAASGTVYWDELQVWVLGTYTYLLPSVITMEEQVIGVIGYRLGDGAEGAGIYIAGQRRPAKLNYELSKNDWPAVNEARVIVDVDANVRPYAKLRKPITAPAADYVTTVANTIPVTDQQLDIIVTGLEAEVMERVAFRVTGDQRKMQLARSVALRNDFRYKLYQAGLGKPIHEFRSSRETGFIR